MALELGPEHKETRERKKMVLEAEPEKGAREEELEASEAILPFLNRLPQLIVKSYFSER